MENTFIPYEKALSIIEAHKGDFPTESRNLENCIGAYLAEDLIADRDFPPFDRVTMDGIAIVYGSFEKGQRTFTIESTAAAGTPQLTLKDPQHCIEVMTGAIMPKGVDTVIRYEDLELTDTMTDILYNYESKKITVIHNKTIETINTHGTGCSLSSSIATYVGLGFSLEDACIKGCAYLNMAIAEGKDMLLGHGHGPVNHFYKATI